MIPEKSKAASGANAAAFGFVSAWDSSDKAEHNSPPRIIKIIRQRCRVSEAAAYVIAELASIGGAVRL
jgi:hypothetical protein